MAGQEYRNVSDHVEDLASGRTLAPGESVGLSKADLDEAHNKELVERGVLIPTKQPKQEEGGS